ncbi:hypothetical protein FOA52_004315 [Chlamydomonas sp. UWO 241]|nr:hypothetical protein FOA52_004315 [Chlamydomonas sp. UWO 241]
MPMAGQHTGGGCDGGGVKSKSAAGAGVEATPRRSMRPHGTSESAPCAPDSSTQLNFPAAPAAAPAAGSGTRDVSEHYCDASRAQMSTAPDEQLRSMIPHFRDSARLESFIAVLAAQGRERLVAEAEAALAVLFRALAIEAKAARAARIAESKARTAALNRPKSVVKRKRKGSPRRSLRQAGVDSAPCIPSTCDQPEDAVGSVPATAAALQAQLGLPRAAARQLVMLSSAHLSHQPAAPAVEWDRKWKLIKTANPEDYHDANRAQVLCMSDGALRRSISGMRNTAKLRSLVAVLKEHGREDLAEGAVAALAVLLEPPPPPPPQPALTAFEEARVARIATNEARMASILSGLAQAKRDLADSKKDLAPRPAAKRLASSKREYSVEAILDHQDVGSGKALQREYLVAWTGFGPEHNSWEPEVGIRRTAFYAAYWRIAQ